MHGAVRTERLHCHERVAPVLTGIAVSNPDLGAEPTGASSPGSGPASTVQLATSVAPFQLAKAVTA